MSDDSYLKEFISFANILADKSSEIIMQFFRHQLNIETKMDNTPVTIADKNSEEKIVLRKEVTNSMNTRPPSPLPPAHYFFLMILLPLISTIFPNTTIFLYIFQKSKRASKIGY